MVLRLMGHALRPQRAHTRLGYGLFSDPPSRAEVEDALEQLARAIEAADGTRASEAIYRLSRLFRQSLRERSSAAERASMRADDRVTRIGGRS
jgi:hypothetical protein